MLFRSDFLKRGYIPQEVESHQNTLSGVAAACWHSLSAADKDYWKCIAQEKKKEHADRYPGYQYKPRPKVDKITIKQRMTAAEKKTLYSNLRTKYVPDSIMVGFPSYLTVC